MINLKRSDFLIASLFTGLTVSSCLTYLAHSAPVRDRTFMQENEATIYDCVPEPLRQSLITRLNLFLKYRIADQWEDMYGLLAANMTKGKSKAEVVIEFRKDPGVAGTGRTLISFLPKKVVASKGDSEWFIYGCAKLKGVKMSMDAFIIASRQADEWRFSDIDMLTPRDTTFRQCAYDHKVKKSERTKR